MSGHPEGLVAPIARSNEAPQLRVKTAEEHASGLCYGQSNARGRCVHVKETETCMCREAIVDRQDANNSCAGTLVQFRVCKYEDRVEASSLSKTGMETCLSGPT